MWRTTRGDVHHELHRSQVVGDETIGRRLRASHPSGRPQSAASLAITSGGDTEHRRSDLFEIQSHVLEKRSVPHRALGHSAEHARDASHGLLDASIESLE